MNTALPSRVVTDEAVIAVTNFYSVLEGPINREDLLGPSRQGYVVKVRMLAMYALKKILEMSYPAIGEVMERDHTSVLAACRRVVKDFDPEEVAEVLEYVRVRLDRQRRELRERLFEEAQAS